MSMKDLHSFRVVSHNVVNNHIGSDSFRHVP
jgi:hypothetical protein